MQSQSKYSLVCVFIFLIILCVWVFCFHLCLFTTCIPGTWQRPQEGISVPGSGVTDLVRIQVANGTLTRVLWESNRCAQLLSSLCRTFQILCFLKGGVHHSVIHQILLQRLPVTVSAGTWRMHVPSTDEAGFLWLNLACHSSTSVSSQVFYCIPQPGL